jgi:F-type H+-transporting ATPase subunit b
MQINWFTVIAQVINFLVLVWLLKKFLYKPILKAVDDREKMIAAQVIDAKNLKVEAKKEQDEFVRKNADFDQQKKGLMEKAIAEASGQRQQLLDKAKDAANLLSSKLEAASRDKQKRENLEIAEKIQMQVFAITRKALTEIASESLEEQSVGTFIRRLNEAKEEEKKQFIEAFKSNANTILIRSAFDLPVKQQNDISNAIDTILATKATLQFKTVPGIISGIELTTNGYKMAWSFSEYLHSLEENISKAIKTEEQQESGSKAGRTTKQEPEENGKTAGKSEPEKNLAPLEN